jgi:hypothetical protein
MEKWRIIVNVFKTVSANLDTYIHIIKNGSTTFGATFIYRLALLTSTEQSGNLVANHTR